MTLICFQYTRLYIDKREHIISRAIKNGPLPFFCTVGYFFAENLRSSFFGFDKSPWSAEKQHWLRSVLGVWGLRINLKFPTILILLFFLILFLKDLKRWVDQKLITHTHTHTHKQTNKHSVMRQFGPNTKFGPKSNSDKRQIRTYFQNSDPNFNYLVIKSN